MIKIVKTIQVQNTIHLKNNNKTNVLNKKNDYMKKKFITTYLKKSK